MSNFLQKALVATLFAAPACSPSGPVPPPAAPLDMVFGDVREIPMSMRPTAFFDTEGGLIVVVAEGNEERILASTDEGATWAPRGVLPLVQRRWAAHEGCSDLHRIEVLHDGLFYVDGLDGARPRPRIADSTGVEVYGLAVGGDQQLGAVWIARGRGWPELMFSQSLDHGASWSPPVRVNTESRRKEMAQPALLHHEKGWVLLWTENRDARTLFDVYGSFSSDGRNWSQSRRLNDDEEPSFSVGATGVAEGRLVHVLTQDYREINRFGDRDGNIYYARMADDPARDLPNVRVNDVTDGPQAGAALARDAETGWLFAAWLDSRNRLTGDIYASTSRDGGTSWTPNRRVSVNARPERTDQPWMTNRRAGGLYIGWTQAYGAIARGWLRRITPGPAGSATRDEPLPPKLPGPLIDPLPPRQLVAEARFDGDFAEGIAPLAGSWIVRDGALLSFGHGPIVAEWKVPPLADFVIEGRFRLDPKQHVAAHLFLRAHAAPDDPDVLDGYQLRNHFRIGVMLSHTRATIGRGDRPPAWATEPLTDRWFPLRQNSWYRFRAVVVGRRLDYWIDGEWMLSHDALDVRPGAIVLGADARGPVEWDDLRLYSLDSSQADSSR